MAIGNQDQSRNLCGLRIDFQAKKPEETPSTTSAPIDQDVIDWDGPNDAWNPYTWSKARKMSITMLWILMSSSTSIQSSVFSGTNEAVSIEFGIGEEVAVLGTSLYILGYAFGPAAFGPLSEKYGRKLPALTGLLISSILCVPIAMAYNTETILICRFLGGVFGAAPLATLSGGIADIWKAVDRGVALSTLLGAAFVGVALGPILGAFITASSLGWRWTMWFNAIFGVLVSIMVFLWLPETYAPVVLSRKASKIRTDGKRWAARSRSQEEATDLSRIFKNYIIRPWVLLTEPILFWMTGYSAFVYGLLYLCFEAYPVSFVDERGWKLSTASLPLIGVGGGIVLGTAIIVADIKLRAMNRPPAEGCASEPEAGLAIMMLGSFLIPLGLLWYGWSSDPSVHWSSQVLAGLMFSTGLFIIYISCLVYIVNCYLATANSAISANTCVRAIFGAAFPLFAKTMHLRLGVKWATSTLAFIAAAAIPIPILFFKYGARLRARSNRQTTTTALLLASAIGANAIPQGVPELPKLPTQQGPGCAPLPAGFKIPGAGVEMRPQDIPTGCSAFEVLIARGTSEPNFKEGNGKFGLVVGDPLIGNLTAKFPSARGYPVQYPADSNIIPGVRAGTIDLLARLESQSKACPDQKFALVGYSQGAGLMHNAVPKIPEATQKKVLALLMYGDPELRNGASGKKFPAELEKVLLQNCAEGDMVCDKGSCFAPHLQYIRQPWVDRSVEFLIAAFKGTPLPAKTSGVGFT
ncbi:hypothetical protein EG328_003298 [Venturia inaequalis]|uniref:Major facilitator superfamily (MFS) profile domain-containing protein n=1 Tax=Venturia inaequalis TaxID=5025 RepID=A0A8H3VFA7_VENIN|nr:hypothetical protein EG328_003298 [Venturia inaequalis]